MLTQVCVGCLTAAAAVVAILVNIAGLGYTKQELYRSGVGMLTPVTSRLTVAAGVIPHSSSASCSPVTGAVVLCQSP